MPIPAWLPGCYVQFQRSVLDPDYPCFMGTTAERNGHLMYSYVEDGDISHLPQTLSTFLAAIDADARERHNLTVFFRPDRDTLTHEDYRARLWSTLGYLHDHDPKPWPQDVPVDPDHPRWEFCFAGVPIFLFAAAPSYRRRASRNLCAGLIMLFQPRHVFDGLEAGTRQGDEVRRITRKRLVAWDGMAVHPDLRAYGDPGNREWKQYFLADDNGPEAGRCPFHTHARANEATESPRPAGATPAKQLAHQWGRGAV